MSIGRVTLAMCSRKGTQTNKHIDITKLRSPTANNGDGVERHTFAVELSAGTALRRRSYEKVQASERETAIATWLGLLPGTL